MKDKIRDFILHGGDFNKLALELYSHQVQQNKRYGSMCHDVRPTHWKEIPAVPVDLFRSLALCCFPPFAARFVFLTSGTTGQKGVHRLLDTELYDLGALSHMEDVIGHVPEKAISLVSTASTSSLGHMCRLISPNTQHFFVPEQGLYKEEAWTALRECNTPIFFPGTSFAFAELIEGESTPCSLPHGSIMMITGGFKGYTQKIEAQELHQRLRTLFPNTRIVAEYGMTELSTQLWSPDNDNRYIPPQWMKVIAVDPSTGKETNNIGQLRFYDLANHQSVLAIETHDQGMVLDDGSVILHGRLPKSVSRGCSLDMETVKKQEPPTSYAPIIHGTYTGSTYLSKSKIEQLLEAFRSLLTLPIHDEYTQGLSLEQFRWGLEQSINALSFNGLETILKKHRSFPKRISIVASYGICSSIIEWVFLSLGAGASVLLKAPSRDHRFHQILCEHLQKYDFPIKCTTTHDLGSPELIYAFGSNQSMDKIQRTHPNTTRFCYGHRFSLIYCSGSPSSASQIAQDLCAYNGRGCMAPVAVCTPKLSTKFIHALEIAIAEHRQTCTAPPIAPSLHPFVRQRIMNTKAIGTLHSRNGTHLCEMPFKHWTQNTLPNLFELHQVSIPELLSQLEPWKNNLSTLGTDLSTSQEVELQAFFPRVVSLGEMQTPVFPRHHDGFPMFMSPSYD